MGIFSIGEHNAKKKKKLSEGSGPTVGMNSPLCPIQFPT